jgi:hypothetical protein
MSMMDGEDFKKKVDQVAAIKLRASFLKVPQAMLVAGFTDEDSQSTAKQMNVRRAMAAAAMEKIPNDTLPVTVPSRSSPTATSSVSTLSMVMVVLPEGVEEINPNPPVLEQVRLTVGASIKVVRNKKKVNESCNSFVLQGAADESRSG